MAETIKGRALKYGDNINTDIISPPAYMELAMEEAAKYAMSPVDAAFASTARPGDIFVAENNLGSGSSRETAPLTLKLLGIRVVIAKSFARIFYRNCINLGILAIECAETDKISYFDELKLDTAAGVIRNLTKNETYACGRIPDHIWELFSAGGLVESLRKKCGS